MASTAMSVRDFYAGVATYLDTIDPTWREDEWLGRVDGERAYLQSVLGPAAGRSVLDCSCGDGGQAIPLAELGWRVTAIDVADSALRTVERHARERGLAVDVQAGDMRDLAGRFPPTFDWAISCMALDNLGSVDAIGQALAGIHAVLKPGGAFLLRLRDLENIRTVRPRYDFKEERAIPHGRVIRLEDWEYEPDGTLVCSWIFLHEDDRKSGYAWETQVFSLPRQVVTRVGLERLLRVAGFAAVELLPQPGPWQPFEVVARKAPA